MAVASTTSSIFDKIIIGVGVGIGIFFSGLVVLFLVSVVGFKIIKFLYTKSGDEKEFHQEHYVLTQKVDEEIYQKGFLKYYNKAIICLGICVVGSVIVIVL